MKLILILTMLTFSAVADTRAHFKRGVDPKEMEMIHPKLVEIVNFSIEWCRKNKARFQLTSLLRSKEDNIRVGSTSDTHVEGRAIDFSIRKEHGWTQSKLLKFQKEIEKKFGKYGAISYTGRVRTIIVYHSVKGGPADHGHIQIKRGLK